MLREIRHLWHSKKEIPYYYFKYLYRNDVKNINDYLGTKEANRLHQNPQLHRSEITTIINNKLAFSLYAQKHGLRTARLYGYHFNHKYFFNETLKSVNTEQSLHHFFQNLFNTYQTTSVFVKPLADFGGKGCFILRSEDLKNQLYKKKEALLTENHLFYEVIKQHPRINEIHSHCVNTLRIVSYITPTGNIEFISTFMRFGIDNSPVDNGSAGGIFVYVDEEKGTLKEMGIKKMSFGGEKLTHHPNSNFKFDGFEIPYFKETYDLITTYLQYLPDRIIGWDVAITTDGPVIIEANDCPNLHSSDVMSSGGLLRNESFRELVTQINSEYFNPT